MIRLNSRVLLQTSSLIMIVLGTVLLGRELYDWIVLPSIYNEEGAYGLITLFKYKENTYRQMFFWTIVVLTGASFWISKRTNWLFYQMLLICTSLILLIHLSLSYLPLVFKLLVLAMIVTVVILLFKQLNKYLTTKEIKKSQKLGSMIIGFMCAMTYFLFLGFFG